ncbi:MAG: type IV pilus assembly protein PilM [Candidatus Omnitrophica bacterium]|nr:type IV pilus assembly protein PilM [Candidatus Omnitrophota bacterium]
MNTAIEKYFLKIKNFLHEKFFIEEKRVSYLGLDIGAFSVKMAQVGLEKDKLSLVNFGISKIKNNNISEAIKEIMRNSDINTETVNIGLCGKGVILRYITLPKMPLKELRQSISTEVDKYIPFPIEDVFLDCYILKELSQENKMFVLIATVKKDIVQERLRLLSSLNLKASVIDINCVALVNVFGELCARAASLEPDRGINNSAGAIAILDIGADVSCLSILKDGLLEFSRDIYIGGNNFSKRIANVLNLDFDAAERLKCNPVEEQWSKNLEICELLLNNFTHELHISFDYYETENNTSISKLYLSGGSAYLKGIDASLNKSLGIETEIWNPISSLGISPSINIDNLKSQLNKLTVAIGLALR